MSTILGNCINFHEIQIIAIQFPDKHSKPVCNRIVAFQKPFFFLRKKNVNSYFKIKFNRPNGRMNLNFKFILNIEFNEWEVAFPYCS